VAHTVPRVGRSCERFPDGFEVHLLHETLDEEALDQVGHRLLFAGWHFRLSGFGFRLQAFGLGLQGLQGYHAHKKTLTPLGPP